MWYLCLCFSVSLSLVVSIFISVFVFGLMMFMFSLEKQDLGAGTMFALLKCVHVLFVSVFFVFVSLVVPIFVSVFVFGMMMFSLDTHRSWRRWHNVKCIYVVFVSVFFCICISSCIHICICICIWLDDVQFGEAGVRGAGTMYALAETTFTKQTSVTFNISNIASSNILNIWGWKSVK